MTIKNFFLYSGIFALSFLLYLYSITNPPIAYFDEAKYVESAQLLNQSSIYKDVGNPPLSVMLISGSTCFFGFKPIAWRLPSALAASFSVLLIFLITRKIIKDLICSFLAAFYFIFDGLVYTQSRIALPNALMVCFMLAAIYFSMQQRKRNKKIHLLLSGIFFGLSISVKWVVISLTPLFLLIPQKGINPKPIYKNILRRILYFVLIPMVIYGSLYGLLWVLTGKIGPSLMGQIVYHWKNLEEGNFNTSHWWSWPLMMKPITLFFQRGPHMTIKTIYAIGNPAIFWTFPLFISAYLWRLFYGNNRLVYTFLLLCYLTQWMQFAFLPQGAYFHYYYAAMPFVCIIMAAGARQIMDKFSIFGRAAIIAHAMLVLLLFIYFYPIISATPIQAMNYKSYFWLKTWR